MKEKAFRTKKNTVIIWLSFILERKGGEEQLKAWVTVEVNCMLACCTFWFSDSLGAGLN